MAAPRRGSVPNAGESLHPGTRLGPYEVHAPIGSGGMGEVYRASDTRLGRPVAIKVIARGAGESRGIRERFAREARVVASLKHPNVCEVYDVGSDAGVDFIVMELLDGETLESRLGRGALPLVSGDSGAYPIWGHDGRRLISSRTGQKRCSASGRCVNAPTSASSAPRTSSESTRCPSATAGVRS